MVPKFVKLLTVQNRGLHTERHMTQHQQSIAHGQLLVWVVIHESAAATEAANFQLFCENSHMTFRVSHGTSHSWGKHTVTGNDMRKIRQN